MPTTNFTQISAIPGVTAAATIPTPYNDTLLTVKIDNTISSKQSMSYRYSFQKNNSPNDQVANPGDTDLTGGNTDDNKLHSFVVNHTYTLSSRKLNVFTFQFQTYENNILGITTNPNIVFPAVQTGANVNVPQQTKERKFQFRDDFSWLAGKHNAKFGVNYINTKLTGFFFFGANGYQITFFDNPLTVIVWVDFWVGLGIVSALVGNGWDFASPLSAAGRWLERRLAERGASALAYPAAAAFSNDDF